MHSKSATAALARKHLDRRLTPLRKTQDLARPARGWIKAIREALGMTTAQLAERMGVAQTRVSRIEKDEVGSAVTLRTLRQAAEAMDCTLVYALVPNQELEQIVRHRAVALTNERLSRTHHTMKLENQALSSVISAPSTRGFSGKSLRATPAVFGPRNERSADRRG